MGPSVTVECVRFLRDGQWRERRFSGLVTFLTGPAGIGKSTPLEAIFYVLGLDSVAVMPEVRSCESLQVVMRVAGMRWSATRHGSGGSQVEFSNLDEGSRVPPVRLPVRPQSPGEQSASDFVMGLLDLPLLGEGTKRLGLRQIQRVMMLRQKAISNTYLDSISDGERELLFEVLLGLRDEELNQLETAFAAAERRHKEKRLFLGQFLKQREGRNLDSPNTIREEATRKRAAHQEASARALEAQRILGEMAAARGKLDFDAEQAKTAYRARQKAADQATQTLAAAEREHAKAEGVLAGMLRRQDSPSRCSACGQALPQRAPGHCRQCDQEVGDGSGRPGQDIEEARARIAALEVMLAGRRREASEAGEHAAASWREVERADAAKNAHQRDDWAPQQQRALEAEKKTALLAGELAQLARRLEEVEFVFALEEEVKVLEKARQDARKALDEARAERAHRRKEILAEWSRLLLARVREVDPRIEQAYINDAFLPVVAGKSFEESSVSGGPKTLRNVCTLLSLVDLGRTVPQVKMPPLLIIDAPASGFGSQGVDARVSQALLEQMINVAADPSPDGYACQIIAALNDPLTDPHSGVHEIPLSESNRFFDDAPLCVEP